MISYHFPQENSLLENCPRSVLNASQVRIRCGRQVEVDHVDVVEGSFKGAQPSSKIFSAIEIELPSSLQNEKSLFLFDTPTI